MTKNNVTIATCQNCERATFARAMVRWAWKVCNFECRMLRGQTDFENLMKKPCSVLKATIHIGVSQVMRFKQGALRHGTAEFRPFYGRSSQVRAAFAARSDLP